MIEDLSRKYFPEGGIRAFEIGAGTGILGSRLGNHVKSFLASDLSFAMSLEARKKLGRALTADGRHLPVKGPFEMVFFLYDGINYLPDLRDYTLLFSEVHRVLVENGLFLFDITTETNSVRNFEDFVDYDDLGDATYVRHSYYDRRKKFQHNDFTMFLREPGETLFSKYTEMHAQRVFSVAEITRAIPSDLFSVEGIWDEFSFQRYSSRSDRIHFLLKKKSGRNHE
jgi:SAM-dependent methyltransferase